MAVKLMRCEVCGEIIDPDDPDYSRTKDRPELCNECNEAYR